MLEANRSKSVE